ncbi:hypothetical protein H4219_002786 [Mycoemilia scoparia]|uniref:AB hydrolase-1 domain-containing protein n=1 Tax=Mycoemilia scoparia TaxID=417184 RepID=A0A9W8A0E1_9FUNG|nr:hypothetical protein H4219_002786 [Mycoemilia scoparia]
MWYNRKSTIFSIAGAFLVAMALAHFVAFFVYLGLANTQNRLVTSNQYLFMWINLVGFILDIQALYVVSTYKATSRILNWTMLWIAYSIIMIIFAIFMIGGYGYQHDVPASIWSVTWIIPALIAIIYTFKARSGYCVSRMMGIDEYRPHLADSSLRSMFYGFMQSVFPPLFWILNFVIAFCLILQALWLASDHRRFPAPGVTSVVKANNNKSSYNMHFWCFNADKTKDKSVENPTFLLFTDFCEPSTSMVGTAQALGRMGYTACVIDRPGYGWSEPGYWPQKPDDVVDGIESGLSKQNIKGPYVLVGYGQGGVWSQLFVQRHADKVAGVALLDTYPNTEILENFAYNKTDAMKNLQGLSTWPKDGSDDPPPLVDPSAEHKKSASLTAWRAFSPLAFVRSKNQDWDGYKPNEYLSVHKAMVGNNYYYQACYFEYDGTGTKIYNEMFMSMKSATKSILAFQHWPLRWPAFPVGMSGTKTVGSVNTTINGNSATDSHIPLLLIISETSVDSNCKAQGITDDDDCKDWQALAWFRYRQQQMYYQTLTNNVLLLLCSGKIDEDPYPCSPGFVWKRPEWVAIQLVGRFIGTDAIPKPSESPSSSVTATETSTQTETKTPTSTFTPTDGQTWATTQTVVFTTTVDGVPKVVIATDIQTRTLGDATPNTMQ